MRKILLVHGCKVFLHIFLYNFIRGYVTVVQNKVINATYLRIQRDLLHQDEIRTLLKNPYFQ